MGKGLKIFSSYKVAIALLLIYAAVLAIATFIEKYLGTVMAKVFIYYSPLLFLLYLLLSINFIVSTLKHKLIKLKKWGYLFVHLAFLVILLGALITHTSGKEGVVHLREGEQKDFMVEQTNKGNTIHQLPFGLKLKQFTLTRYPGSHSPSEFCSQLIVTVDGKQTEEQISMNRVLDIKGYRLFQASYDTDEKGTVLSVNKDIVGRNTTYTGYFLLFIGLIGSIFGRSSRFRQLINQLKGLKKVAPILILGLGGFTFSSNLHAKQTITLPQIEINAQHASRFGHIPMLGTDGRVKPINTFSSEVMRKLHKSNKIGTLNSDQFLLSVIALPQMWTQIPFIALPNKEIAFHYDLSEQFCSYREVFDSNGQYKLGEDLERIYQKNPSLRTRFEKDIIKLDEQINIFHQLIHGELLHILPNEQGVDSIYAEQLIDSYKKSVVEAIRTNSWESANGQLEAIYGYQKEKLPLFYSVDNQLKAEVVYNKLNIFNTCKRLYLIPGGLLLILSFVSLFRKSKWIKYISIILIILIIASALYHLTGIGLRWYIAGRAPWSNSYETMVNIAFITVVGGLLFIRQNIIPVALSTLFAGIILFVSGLSWMNPQITPLVPVLKSPWLMTHVATIIISYGFFGISFLLGLTNLILSHVGRSKRSALIELRVKELTIINEMSLWIGLSFLIAGTFLGAIWANESWGRYWGWDPKETWALITIVVYTVATHLRLVRKWNTARHLNLAAVVCFAAVLMTYLGVNYWLTGMHSYGA